MKPSNIDPAYAARLAAGAAPASDTTAVGGIDVDLSGATDGDVVTYVAANDDLELLPPAAAGAPTDVEYLVGTASGALSAEIVVGTTPGGDLGGSWGSPTVDATHSGSAHSDFIAKAIVVAKGDLIAATADNTPGRVPVGADGTHLRADSSAAAGVVWSTLHFEPHVAYDGTVVLNGAGDPVMVEVA